MRVLWLGILLALSLLVPAPAAGTLPRTVVVISDLHFGEGKDGNDWSKLEDFRWGDDFKGFLSELRKKWPGGVDLVLNGDTFELWQSSNVPCGVDGVKDLGCSEGQALKRLQRALAEHQAELAELNAFAEANHHVWIVPGNHDAGLLFASLQKELKKSLPSPNVGLVDSGVFVSADGSVVVEHGHMLGNDPNHLKEWPRPFVGNGGDTYLRSPWGERFVKEYYNDWEKKYPIIDNITEELAGAGLAIQLEGAKSTFKASADFVQFYVAGVSWPQLGGSLGDQKYDGSPIDWDTSKLDHTSLAALLPRGDPVRDLIATKQISSAPSFFEADQLRLLCDRALAERGGKPGKDFPCPLKRGTLGALMEAFLRRRKDVIFEHVEKRQQELKQAGAVRGGTKIQTYVYSHTHRAEMPFASRATGPFRPQVINTGAWQRLVTPEQLRKRFQPPHQALTQLKVDDLPRCYHFVAVEPGGEKSPQLLRYPIPSANGWRTVEGNLCERSEWTGRPAVD